MAMVFALLTAAINAVASVLQRLGLEQDVAVDEEAESFLRNMLTSPIWLVGVVLMGLGFVFQAIALHLGSIVVVQPLLLAELPIVALLLVVWYHQPHRLSDLLAMIGAAASLGIALAALDPTDGPKHPSLLRWSLVLLTTAGIAGGALLLARGRSPGPRALLLGLSAASGFGIVAALTKQSGDVLASSPSRLLFTWQVWALALVGVASFFAMQRAFEAGPFAASQSAIILGTPLFSVLVGAALFGCSASSVPWRILVGALAGCALLVATWWLIASPLVAGAHDDPTTHRLTGKGLLAKALARRRSRKERDLLQ